MSMVATVLTVYGIETYGRMLRPEKFVLLQQCLPFTVLKHTIILLLRCQYTSLQQCLPFTVLKPVLLVGEIKSFLSGVATVLTVYGMRRRVRDSRGAKRRLSPHISST